MSHFARGKRAKGVCDRCGFVFLLDELRTEIENRTKNGLRVCEECFDGDHPQLHVGELPIYDPQALRDSRSDRSEWAASREQRVPVTGVQVRGRVGNVTVIVT